MQKKIKFAQVSIEYLIVVGFVTFVLISILGIAFFYSGIVRDKIKENQINSFANKVISTSESVFYSGAPSKATITAYLPDNVKDISIAEDAGGYTLFINFSSGSGLNKRGFSSKVHIEENSTSPISHSQGLKKIEITAQSDKVIIGQAQA